MSAWCKVSATLDNHPKIRRAGNLGRQVFEFALRRNAEVDRNGVVPAEHFEPGYLASILMITDEQARRGVDQCVSEGLLTKRGLGYLVWGGDFSIQTDPFRSVVTYALESIGLGVVKVGRTGDIARRITELRTAHHGILELFGTVGSDCEIAVHSELESIHKRVRGEWFKFDYETMAILAKFGITKGSR